MRLTFDPSQDLDPYMKCKVFNIRLSENHTKDDESALNDFLKTVKVAKTFSSIIKGPTPFWSTLVLYEEGDGQVKPSSSAEEITLNSEEKELYEALRTWRNKRAIKENLPAYVIAHNLWLKQMVKTRVKTKEDLINIEGFSKKRTEKYGNEILEVIKSAPKSN